MSGISVTRPLGVVCCLANPYAVPASGLVTYICFGSRQHG